MPHNPHLRFLLLLVYCGLGLLFLWLLLTYLLPWLLPFFLAFLLATLLEPLVLLLSSHCHLSRSLSGPLCTLLLAFGLGCTLFLIISRGWYELGLLFKELPSLLEGMPSVEESLSQWVLLLESHLPTQFQGLLHDTILSILLEGIVLPQQFYDWLSSLLLAFVTSLPAFLLGLFTTILATCFITTSRPVLLAYAQQYTPATWRPILKGLGRQLKQGCLGWCRAQGLLIFITFCQVTVGFILLQVNYPLLLALLVALFDALPVFGSGTLLLPWCVLSFLRGNSTLGLWLILLYGSVLLVRNVLEPRLLGDRLGLHPLVALLSLYLGFQLFGVLGMVLAPLFVVLVRSLVITLVYFAHQ